MPSWFRSVVRWAIFRVYTYIAGRPQLNAFVKRSIAQFPPLDRRLQAITQTEWARQFQAAPTHATHVADLTPRAYRVYLDLVRALKHGQ
jgi:hypothetical protein